MGTSLLLSALLAGLVGGWHCATMCGGFIAAAAAHDSGHTRLLLPARAILRRQLACHAGRLTSYAALGAVFGATGAATVEAARFLPLQQALYVVANVLLLTLAISIASRRMAFPWVTRAGMGVFARALPWVSPLMRGSGPWTRPILGVVWGFVPCTLVYGVLPLALFAGGAWQGGMVMLAFGLGTVPHVAGFSCILQKTQHFTRSRAMRQLATVFIAGFALFGLYRAFYLPETLAQGPFCLVP